jgi:hypothetical protein
MRDSRTAAACFRRPSPHDYEFALHAMEPARDNRQEKPQQRQHGTHADVLPPMSSEHLDTTRFRSALVLTPTGTVQVEDVGKLQGVAPHEPLALPGWQPLQRTDHAAQQLVGHMGVHRGGLHPMDCSPLA